MKTLPQVTVSTLEKEIEMENQFSHHRGFPGRKPIPASVHGKDCEYLKVEISLKKARDKGKVWDYHPQP